MLPYALTIFSGAFLLFQIQPLIGKYILPWFGGGPGVWTTCMLFFQVVLLAGYAYAHLSTRLLRPRAQAVLHLLLVVAALALQPITPAESWKPTGETDPVWHILLLLTCSLGLPYFVLSATGPLMQQWFSRTSPGISPYRLYALSNVGSLLALLSYPFFFELHFTRHEQAVGWGVGLGVYALGCLWCVRRTWKSVGALEATATDETGPMSPPTWAPVGQRLLWLLLPACASVLLLATTNKMCQDVAVIPFLWVLPLALYLLSFIVAFDSPRWYERTPYALVLVAALASVSWVMFAGTNASLLVQVGVYSAGLFVFCLVCHGELYRLRPPPSQLTGFYLTISAGGATGGMLVGLVAPLVFQDYLELHAGLVLCAVLFMVVCQRDQAAKGPDTGRGLALGLTGVALVALLFVIGWTNRKLELGLSDGDVLRVRLMVGGLAVVAAWFGLRSGTWRSFRHARAVSLFWMTLGTVTLAWVLGAHALEDRNEMIFRARNFYGTLGVLERDRDFPEVHHRILQHGRITHGLQLVDPARAQQPTTYYGPRSGLGLALAHFTGEARHVGVIGLGTGTIAAYGRPGDRFRMYEINPTVKAVASTIFTYLKKSPAQIDVVLGDARLSLEREPAQAFDVLALDAFSSDAIPVHLLTKEAMALYARHMKSDGVIAVHISNRYLDLEPVVLNLAQEFGYGVAAIAFDDEDERYDDTGWWDYSSTWVLLTRNQALLDDPAIKEVADEHASSTRKIPLWTDDFASLFQILQ